MKPCDYCGTTIVFGGVKDQGLNFCCKDCYHKGYALVDIRKKIPQDVLLKQTNRIYNGQCPKCQGVGPVDVHTSYRVYSFIIFTSWKSIPRVCCRSCGLKSQIGGIIISMIFGWWGFPWGLLMTPLQMIRNIAAIAKGASNNPSEKLTNYVKNWIAHRLFEKQHGATA